ncbi:hypothetical protein ACPPVU_10975 [Mucilaginibacter sp. McL0603]|uniref:hypothetical protein n=1 Tax=Mucilaginibacter sp. McL0603 TaxID=3415670 RepID=UPI003CF34143
MNLKLIIITSSIVCLSITTFGQYRYIQKLGSLATIALPDTPKVQKANGIDIYIINHKGVIFIAQTGDVHGGLRDIFTANSTDSVYEGYIKGTLRSTNGTLFYKDKIKVNGHDGIEFGYKAKINGQQTYRYQHTVDLNDTLLMCGIWSSDSLSKNEQHLKVFFDGFKVKSAEQLSDDHASELGIKTGKTIAILVFLCIPVLIGGGAIFIIRKIAYRKNKDKSISV